MLAAEVVLPIWGAAGSGRRHPPGACDLRSGGVSVCGVGVAVLVGRLLALGVCVAGWGGLAAGGVLVLNVALPATRFTGGCLIPSMLKVTVPAGVPPLLLTVAVNVTLVPTTEGLADVVRLVLVVATVTVWPTPQGLPTW